MNDLLPRSYRMGVRSSILALLSLRLPSTHVKILGPKRPHRITLSVRTSHMHATKVRRKKGQPCATHATCATAATRNYAMIFTRYDVYV